MADAYEPRIIDISQYDEIRDRLGLVSDEVLTNDIIEKTSYLQKAEAYIIDQVTDWEAILEAGGIDAITLQVTVIALTAYYLLPRLQQLVKSENILDYSYTAWSPEDWAKKKQDLLAEVDLTQFGVMPEPLIHTLSGPTRAEIERVYPDAARPV